MAQATARDLHDMGILFATQGRHADAALAFQKALLLKPDYADAWTNRANAMTQIAQQFGPPYTELMTFDAILGYGHAISHQTQSAELGSIYNNRGVSWVDIGQHRSGVADYEKAAELNPALPQIFSNIGNVRKYLGDVEGARRAYAKAKEVDPKYYDAAFNEGLMDLELGNFEEGWKLFELRWRSGQLAPRGLPCPDWEGEDLNGKRLLLYAEQGFGDTFHFVRYAQVIKGRYPDCHITFECRLSTARLCKTVPGVDEVVVYGDPLYPHDYGCAIMSAPRVLGTTFETIPAPIPYLSVDQHRVDVWRERLDHDTKPFGERLRVGICWSGQGRPLQPLANAVDKRRSTVLGQWGPLAAVPGVLFVSLQTGDPATQARMPPQGMTIAHYSDELDDFTDTAALMKCLDLVISVDTAVVHVAGALGLPTWMLSRFDGCWRWHGDRRDSPWYPTLTQFRQPRLGDWTSVFDQVAKELREFQRGERAAMAVAAE